MIPTECINNLHMQIQQSQFKYYIINSCIFNVFYKLYIIISFHDRVITRDAKIIQKFYTIQGFSKEILSKKED